MRFFLICVALLGWCYNSQQHYGWVSVSDKDGTCDVWLIFWRTGNGPEISGNGQMKGEMRRLMRKWTGNDSGNEPEMDRK